MSDAYILAAFFAGGVLRFLSLVIRKSLGL
jgi:hypothetical protein